MSTAPLLLRIPPETPRGNQRSNSRYPIALELQYKLLNKGRAERLGSGRTLNISSGGVLFQTDDVLPVNGMIELAMKWPYLLAGVCSLKLVMRGRIVRTDANVIGVKSEFYEFRTAGVRSAQGDPTISCGAS